MITGLIDLDVNAYLWLNRLQHNSPLITLNRWISHSGDGHLYVGIAVLVYLSAPVEYADFIKVGLLAFLVELPCFVVLKALIKRDRPFVQLHGCQFSIEPSDKFSMPSGHTAAAFLMAGLISAFYPEYNVLAYSWAMLIGFSRVILGVHYPSDILAGAALGSSALFVSLALLF